MRNNFEWDAVKARSNLRKHKISFEDASEVFEDPDHDITDVTQPEYDEERFRAIGMLKNGRLVTVIYTHRGRKRRIISAWKATKNEQRDYDSGKASS
jgi:uncharacterized DUF497 family protein